MSEATTRREIRLAEERRLDGLCDEFEAAWVTGQNPHLEAFLARLSESDRPLILGELLAIEIHHRRRRGDSLTPREYTERLSEWMDADLQMMIARLLSTQHAPKDSQPEDEATSVVLPVAVPPKSKRYRITKMHARGGMGEIWLADDLEIGRRVAYKRMRTNGEPIQERFFSEAQITGQLEHPGVVPVHELGRDADGNPFYVMRLVQGKTFKDVIAEAHAEMAHDPKSRELSWLKLLEVFLALCRTVAYAHHRGVIHRDIKPDNIMIGTYGETLVVDWGLAKVLDAPDLSASRCVSVLRSGGADSTATQDGNVLGSPPYMSPEMAEGRIGEEDVKTDIYLLGATLYQLLTNRPPRHGSSREEIINLARTTPPTPPRTVNPAVPRALEAICIKAMAHGKTDRYESAREVADEIERYLAGEPVQAHREPFSDILGRWLRRNRRMLSRASVAAVLLLALGGTLLGWRQAAEQARLAKIELAQRELVDRAAADIEEFQRLSEQLHFALAESMPLDDRLSFSDPKVATERWSDIQKIVGQWQPDLADFPLAERRDWLRRELAQLTLWRVQQEVARPLTGDQAKQLSADLDRIVVLNPPAASLARLRATCFMLAGQSELAIQSQTRAKDARLVAFDHFLEGERLRFEAMKQVGGDDEERSTWRPSRKPLTEAVAAYQRCLNVDATHFWSHLQKGRCHLLIDQPKEALGELNSAVALRPESAWAWTVRGFAQSIPPLSHFEAAEHDLDHALELDSKFAIARLYRGAARLLHNQFEAAKEEFRSLTKEYPENLQARYYLALAEHKADNLPAASALCDAIINDRPDLRPPRLLRIRISLAQRNTQQARAHIDQWLTQLDSKLDLAGPAAAARRSQLLRVLAESSIGPAQGLALSLALAEAQAAIKGGVKSATLYDDLAANYLGRGQFKEAIAATSDGLECPTSEIMLARLHHTRGLAYVELREFENAKQDFAAEAAVKGDGRLPQIHRADAHALLGYVAALELKASEAQRKAAESMAQLREYDHYSPWINLACVYNALADKDPPSKESLQDIAMVMLSNAMHQAQRIDRVSEATRKIRGDSALESLQSRPDFLQIIPPLRT